MESQNILERKKQVSEIRREIFPMSMKEAEQWRKYKTSDARYYVYGIGVDTYQRLRFDFSDVYSASQDEKIKMGNQLIKNIFWLCFNIYHQQQMLIRDEKYHLSQEDVDNLVTLYKRAKNAEEKNKFFLCLVYDAYFLLETKLSHVGEYFVQAVITMAMYLEFLDMNSGDIHDIYDIHVLTDILDGDETEALNFIDDVLSALKADCDITFDIYPTVSELSDLLRRIYSLYETVIDNGGWEYQPGAYMIGSDGKRYEPYAATSDNLCNNFLSTWVMGWDRDSVYGQNCTPDGYYNPLTGELILEIPTYAGCPEKKYPLLMQKKIKAAAWKIRDQKTISETFEQFGMEL